MARPQRKYKYKYVPYGLRGQFKSWDEYQEANMKLPCANPACTALRHNRSKYCASCSRYATMLGDARYRPVKIVQYKQYIDQAKEVIAFNPSNIMVTDFVDKWETLADQGRQELPIEYATWWAGIHKVIHNEDYRHRRDAKNQLAYFVGVYMFYSATGNEFIKNDKMWHFTLADVGLRKCKLAVRPKATGKRMQKFGKYLWGAFSLYWLKIAYATMANERHKQIRDKQLQEAELLLPAELITD
jgi:hypothetical protein